MIASRPCVLGGVSALFVFLAAILLIGVLAAVPFAITVAYLLVPLRRRFEACEASQRVAGPAATIAAAAGVGVVFAPLAVIFFLRLSDILEPATLLPDVITIEFFRIVETATLDDVVVVGLGLFRLVGRTATIAALVAFIKLTLFGLLVFALLLSGDAVGQAFSALAPADYRGVMTTLNEWACEMLLTICALQAATVAGTFAVGLVVFQVLDYDYAVMLVTIAAVLQFIPIAGPSVLLAVMAVYHAAAGGIVAAALVVALFAEPVDLLGAELRVNNVGGDGDERDELVDDLVDLNQP